MRLSLYPGVWCECVGTLGSVVTFIVKVVDAVDDGKSCVH